MRPQDSRNTPYSNAKTRNHHHQWWHLTPRPQTFQPAKPPRPSFDQEDRVRAERRYQDEAALLGNTMDVSLARQNFNDDLSVTAWEAAYERRNYWRLPPEVRDRIYTDHMESSVLNLERNLSVTTVEAYHEAMRGSQAENTSRPVHMTSASMAHNALFIEPPGTYLQNQLDQRRGYSQEVLDELTPTRANPGMRGSR